MPAQVGLRKVALRHLQLPTSSTSRRGGYSCGFDLRLDPIRLAHVGALKWLSTEEHDLEDSQQTIDPTRKDVGNCKMVSAAKTRRAAAPARPRVRRLRSPSSSGRCACATPTRATSAGRSSWPTRRGWPATSPATRKGG